MSQRTFIRSFSYTRLIQNKPKFQATSLPQQGKQGTNMFMSQHMGPPKLPDDEQAEFERLQKTANSQAAIDEYNLSVSDTAELAQPNLKDDIGGFSPEYFKTKPEFEGDVNPVTGEIGGPKQEPLRHGDWSFNGRVTDF